MNRESTGIILNVGIVGLGPHGRRMLQIVLANKRFNLVGVADQNPKAFADLRLNGAAVYADAAVLLKMHAVDLWIVTTNGPSHFPLAKAAMESGVKRILVSKPLACTLHEAREMVALSKHHGVRLAVDHGLRHDQSYNWLRSKIRSGEWGILKSVYVMRNGIGLGCLGVHSFDLINSLTEARVREVTGWVDAPVGVNPRGSGFCDPGGLVILTYENGVRGIVSQIEEGAGPMSVEINLTGARIRVNEKFREMEVIRRNGSHGFKAGSPAAYEKVELPSSLSVRHDTVELMERVLEDLAGDAALKCDAILGEHSVEILVAAHLSSERNHSPVALPLEGEEALHRFLPVT